MILGLTVLQDKPDRALIKLGQGLGVDFLFHSCSRELLDPDPERNRALNIAIARNELRAKALEHPADWFFFLDSDVVPPKHAVESMLKTGRPAVGGWVPIKSTPNRWMGGRWLLPWLFGHFEKPEPGLTDTDMLSLACALVKRSLVEAIRFEAGIDQKCMALDGESYYLADSGALGLQLLNKGVQPVLDGNVVCNHI